eukprot:531901-Pyramimonas_sp.AAC.1
MPRTKCFTSSKAMSPKGLGQERVAQGADPGAPDHLSDRVEPTVVARVIEVLFDACAAAAECSPGRTSAPQPAIRTRRFRAVALLSWAHAISSSAMA